MKRSPFPGVSVCLAFFLLLLLAACNSGEEEPAGSLVTEGEKLFKKHCTVCHSVKPDRTITGPSLYGVASRAGERMPGLDAREYLHLSIIAPGEFVLDGFSDVMVADFAEKLTPEEIDAVIAYLMTLE